jgi:hypothetical protein
LQALVASGKILFQARNYEYHKLQVLAFKEKFERTETIKLNVAEANRNPDLCENLDLQF